jgi:hypothetical protein
MLFLANDNLVKYFSGGKFTILSIQLEDIDNFYTRVRVLKTDVSSLSIGGIYIGCKLLKK